MNFEITDRTDHNRIAEQFAARLREQEPAAAQEVKEAAQKPPKPKRAPRLVEPVAPVIVDPAPAAEVEIPVAPAVTRQTFDPSDLEIITCEQNSPEWHRARMGIPTSSSFDAILTPGKTKGEQKTRRTYMLKLAGEILTGEPIEMVQTRDMERGHLLEPEARDLYTLQTGETPNRVGFLRRGRVGCSPDSLIGDDGGLEIKTKAPHLLIDVILKDEFPEEHKAQVQGALWITGREWWDIAVYWPGLPLFVKRAYRDEVYIQNLANEVDRFNSDLDAIVADMQRRIEQEAGGIEFAAKAA
jgi:YqaJ-like viral recombinase domain